MKTLFRILILFAFSLSNQLKAQTNVVKPAILQFRGGTGIGQSQWNLNQISTSSGSNVSIQKDYSSKGVYIPLNADVLLRLGLFKIGAGVGTDFNLIDSLKSGGDGAALFRGKPALSKFYGQLESDMIRLGGFTAAINLQAGGFKRFNFKESLQDNFFVNAGLTFNINNGKGIGIYIKPTIEYKQQTSLTTPMLNISDGGTQIKNIDSSINYYIAFGVTFGLF